MNESDSQTKLYFLLTTALKFIPKSYVKFRSYLNLCSSNLASSCGLKLPKFFTSKNISCPFCFTPWELKCNSFKLLPSTSKKFKIDVTNNKINGKTLKLKQSGENNEILLRTKNKLVLNCLVCTKKSNFSLAKPVKAKDESENAKYLSSVSKKRKKKKKDPCVNLNLKACKAAGMKKSMKKRKNKEGLFGMAQEEIVVSSLKNSDTSVFQRKIQIASNTKLKYYNPKQNKNFSSSVNKKLQNSYGSQNKNFGKNVKQLVALKRAVKEEKIFSKSSLKNFLHVIGV